MKLALLGDVHGNSAALRAVLAAVDAENIDTLLVTGDLVGYYFDARGTLELLQPWRRFMVRGNHEDMLAEARRDRRVLSAIEEKYGSGLRIALETLTHDQLEELCTLPHPLRIDLDGMSITLCHGAPWDNDFYIYPDAPASVIERCAGAGSDMVVIGHTHYPMVVRKGELMLVNPGSVGQPRNRQRGAQWAVVDTRARTAELRNEPYDQAPVVAEARARHPDLPYLAGVLERV